MLLLLQDAVMHSSKHKQGKLDHPVTLDSDMFNWLVVYPSEKYESVSWDLFIPNIYSNK
jgi:hypothetical protein